MDEREREESMYFVLGIFYHNCDSSLILLG